MKFYLQKYLQFTKKCHVTMLVKGMLIITHKKSENN